MSNYTVVVHPKKAAYDPLAAQVRAELVDAGESSTTAQVSTQRLFRLSGGISSQEVKKIAPKLLVDPVVEDIVIAEEGKTKTKPKAGAVVDVWLKPGVTDPVGETVQKGFRDLGFLQELKASSGIRYIFPKIKDSERVKEVAQRFLANNLIHDINIK